MTTSLPTSRWVPKADTPQQLGPQGGVRLCTTPTVRSEDSIVSFDWRDSHRTDGEQVSTAATEFGKVVRRTRITDSGMHVTEQLSFDRPIPLRAFHDVIHIAFESPDRIWLPHLCPEDGDVVSDHAYRSPLALIREGAEQVAVVPDLNVLAAMRFSTLGTKDHCWTGQSPDTRRQLPAYMVMLPDDHGGFKIEIGLAHSQPRGHLYYQLTDEPVLFDAGDQISFAYDLMFHSGKESQGLRAAVSHIWQRYSGNHTRSALPQKRPLRHYAHRSLTSIEHTPEYVEFTLADGNRGAGFRNCSSINGNDIDSTNFKVPPRSIWFSAWFNSFRTAFGIASCTSRQRGSRARRWRQRAEWIKQTLLNAPDKTGFGLIPTIYGYEDQQWWSSVPAISPGRDYFDIAATCHTAVWMLRWHKHIEADDRLVNRVRSIVRFLMDSQEADGSFPSYVDATGRPHDLLRSTAQSSAASALLAEWAEHEADEDVTEALHRSARYYIDEILPQRRYHDYEAFYSCSDKPLDFSDTRTRQEVQNTLSLAWIVETLLRTYAITGDEELKPWAQRAVDDLCLYQQVWNPPYVSLYTFGGFGVMNTDGEWSDTRGVWMSDLLMRAGRLLGQPEYIERGIAALRATCALLCDPLHADVNPCRYDSYPVGLAPENFAHLGYDGRAIRSSFDWGAGALLVAGEWMRKQYGQLYIHIASQRAFGIDGIVVEQVECNGTELQVTVRETTNVTRNIDVVIEYAQDQSRTRIHLEGGSVKQFNVTCDASRSNRLLNGAQL